MDTEVIAITQREDKRYKLLLRVLSGDITLAAAVPALGVGYRQAKRLKKAVEKEGIKGLAHGNRGRGPANKTDAGLREKVLNLSGQRYQGFNDAHFTEMLLMREGVDLSRETVRKIRREAGVKPKQKRRATKHHKRRPRKSAEGMMMLWDGSPHRWFGEDIEPCCLMAAMDDATGKAILRLTPFESSHGYLSLLYDVVKRHGIPASIYQDMHGALRRNDDNWTIEEELAGRQEPTQVGAALEALGIESIFALSPQAKGRIERLFKTAQDRLPALFKLEGIKDIDEGNRYIQEHFIEEFNRRFSVEPESATSVFRKPGRGLDLDRVISLRYDRIVGNDNAIRLEGLIIDVPPGPGKRSYAGVRAEVRQLLDGSWRVYYKDNLIATAEATTPSEPIRTLRRRKGVRAGKEAVWVNMASNPKTPSDQPDGTSRASTSVGTIRRAGT